MANVRPLTSYPFAYHICTPTTTFKTHSDTTRRSPTSYLVQRTTIDLMFNLGQVAQGDHQDVLGQSAKRNQGPRSR